MATGTSFSRKVVSDRRATSFGSTNYFASWKMIPTV
jgi:hypothetical protein